MRLKKYILQKIVMNDGVMSHAQLKQIIKSYNGSGPDAEKYAQNAMANLQLAMNNQGVLYFYEK